jgi:LemA protein
MALLEWIGLGIIVLILIAIAAIYNGFIAKRNRVQNSLAQIDVQLKRRYDLIPNLIETVKGYAKYEKSVLTQVTSLRTSIMSGSVDDKLKANDKLSRALKSIFAVAENYPDLKASENFKELQEQLEGTEDKISYVRTSFNDYVLDYNNSLQTFPGNVFANWFGFKPAAFFQAPAGQSDPVKVDFGDLNGPDAPKAKPKKQKK